MRDRSTIARAQAELALAADARQMKTVTVHRSASAAGVVLEVTYRHPVVGGVGHVDAEREAAEVLGVLLDLPTETRRELQRLMVEFSDTFAAAPGPKAKVHSPVRGGPRGGR